MKKLILPMVFVFASQFLSAQCIPGTLTMPLAGYIIPDSATNFVDGCAGQAYEQIIYIKAPKDTTFLGIPIAVDSFVVNSTLVGLPAYLSVQTVPGLTLASGAGPKTNFDRLIIKGDSLACIRISGNIPAGTSGANNLTISVRAYLGGGLIDTLSNITYYHINVFNPCWPAGVKDFSSSDFEIISAAPNPTNSYSRVAFSSKTNDDYEYKLVNNLGEVIVNEKIKGNLGINYVIIDVNALSNGTYMFSLSNGKNLLSQKIQVNK